MVSAMTAIYSNDAEANGFQTTEIGLLPSDWEVMSAGSIGKFRGGNGFPISFQGRREGKYPFFKVSDMNVAGNEVRMVSANNYLSDADRQRLGSYVFPKDTIVFAKVGAAVFLERKKFLSVPSCIDNNMAGFVIESERIDLEYIYHQFQAFRLSGLVSTTALPSLNGTVLKSIKFPVPPTVCEQSAIAEALNDANALIESLEVLIAKKRQIKQGAMQELLTGKRRLGGFAQPWSKRRIGDLLTIKHGKSQRDVEDQNGAFPILATGGQIGRANKFLWDKPSVLIGRKGTIDRPQYADTPFWTVDTLFYSDIHNGNSAKFIFYRFCLIDWLIHNEASGVPSLNAKTIENIEIDAPEPDEQNEIADLISSMDLEIDALEDRLNKAQQIKQGMMQELLTGRTRLI